MLSKVIINDYKAINYYKKVYLCINIKILNKDCKCIYLFTNSDVSCITDSKEATKLLTNPFKLQLRTKVGNKTGKKI